MKTYKITYMRYNPQLNNGKGIKREINYEANSIKEARKYANKLENGSVYGYNEVISVERCK